jgi:pyruvate dehydrogenase E2 component (dihydrolipoamide acetyltransferase)
MAAEAITMPRMTDTMTEGNIAAWHKKVGDKVKAGDLLAEVETDKATMELLSDYDGTLLHIAIEAGSAVNIGAVIAVIGNPGDDFSGLLNAPSKTAAPAEEIPVAETTKINNTNNVPLSVQAPVITPVPAPAANIGSETLYIPVPVADTADNRIRVSPLAKAVAEEKGIDLRAVQGSGDGGRIIKRDIDKVLAAPVSVPAATIPVSSSYSQSYEEVPVSQMRKTIARRLSESKFTAPHFYLTMAIDMDQAIAFRSELNATATVKISFNDLIIKACAVALKKHPKVNASWLGDKIRYNHHIHIGMAVAVEDGLLVPVIRNADSKGLEQIATESKDFAQRGKNKQLQPNDWEGNTFTISNLGMFGIEEFTAIINPPDACILAVGSIIEQPVVKNGRIVIGNQMRVTLSCDHRVVDGVTGSEFLQTLKLLLENPIRLLL